MKQVKIVAALVLTLLVIIVVLQNTAPVETRLLFITVTMPRAALLALTTLIGFALGLLACLIVGRKQPLAPRSAAGREPTPPPPAPRP